MRGFNESLMAKFLRESFVAQYGETVGNKICDSPEQFSGRHLLEMQAQAEAEFEIAFRRACLDAFAEKEPTHDA